MTAKKKRQTEEPSSSSLSVWERPTLRGPLKYPAPQFLVTPPKGTLPCWLRFDPKERTLAREEQLELLQRMADYLWAKGARPHFFVVFPEGEQRPGGVAPRRYQEYSYRGKGHPPFSPIASSTMIQAGNWTLVAAICDDQRSYHQVAEHQAPRLGLRARKTQAGIWGLDPFERRSDLDPM